MQTLKNQLLWLHKPLKLSAIRTTVTNLECYLLSAVSYKKLTVVPLTHAKQGALERDVLPFWPSRCDLTAPGTARLWMFAQIKCSRWLLPQADRGGGGGGGNASTEPTGKQTRAEPKRSWWPQEQSKAAPPVCPALLSNTSYSISLTGSKSNLLLALCTQLKGPRGTSEKWDRARRWSEAEVQIRPWCMEMRGRDIERASCCLGLPPCSSTQNTALCSAHGCLWHGEQSRGGFSWATEGCWEGRSWLPECLLLSSTRAWTANTRANRHGRWNKHWNRRSMNVIGYTISLPQYCADDGPCHRTTEAQVQPEKPSGYCCSHTNTHSTASFCHW